MRANISIFAFTDEMVKMNWSHHKQESNKTQKDSLNHGRERDHFLLVTSLLYMPSYGSFKKEKYLPTLVLNIADPFLKLILIKKKPV